MSFVCFWIYKCISIMYFSSLISIKEESSSFTFPSSELLFSHLMYAHLMRYLPPVVHQAYLEEIYFGQESERRNFHFCLYPLSPSILLKFSCWYWHCWIKISILTFCRIITFAGRPFSLIKYYILSLIDILNTFLFIPCGTVFMISWHLTTSCNQVTEV